MRRRSLSILLTLLLALSLAMPVYAAEAETVDVLTQPLDYNDKENWAYFETDKEKEADVFLVCPTVDTKSYANTLELNDKVKSAFIYALDLEKGMYSDAGRLFSRTDPNSTPRSSVSSVRGVSSTVAASIIGKFSAVREAIT